MKRLTAKLVFMGSQGMSINIILLYHFETVTNLSKSTRLFALPTESNKLENVFSEQCILIINKYYQPKSVELFVI